MCARSACTSLRHTVACACNESISLLDEKLLKTIPLVNEANAISDELGKMMSFSVKLMANPNKQRTILFDSDAESSVRS